MSDERVEPLPERFGPKAGDKAYAVIAIRSNGDLEFSLPQNEGLWWLMYRFMHDAAFAFYRSRTRTMIEEPSPRFAPRIIRPD